MKTRLILLLIAFSSFAFAQKEKKYLALVRLDGKYGFIDTFGHEVVPHIYDDAGSWGNNLVPVNVGKFIPEPSTVTAVVDPGPPQPKDTTMQHNQPKIKDIDTVEIKEQKGKWGYCNASGQLVIPIQFSNASFFSEGMAAVEMDGKWGFINTTGKIMIEPVYDEVGHFSQGLAAVAKKGEYGFINLKGQVVIPLQYAGADAFENGYTRVFEKYAAKNNNKTSIGRLINLKGEKITDAKYDIVSDLSNDLVSFALADVKFEDAFIYGLMNLKGQILAPPVYREISDFSNGLARVMVYKRHPFYDENVPYFGYINTKGKELIKPKLAKAENFGYGMAVVARFDNKDDGESKNALINTKGEYLLGFNWSSLTILDSKHLFAVAIKNKDEAVIIDPKGKRILSLAGKSLMGLGNGLYTVLNIDNEPIGFIGLNKKTAFDFSKSKKKKFLSYQFGLIRFCDVGSGYEESSALKLGLLDLKGNIIVQPKYSQISDFEPTN